MDVPQHRLKLGLICLRHLIRRLLLPPLLPSLPVRLPLRLRLTMFICAPCMLMYARLLASLPACPSHVL